MLAGQLIYSLNLNGIYIFPSSQYYKLTVSMCYNLRLLHSYSLLLLGICKVPSHFSSFLTQNTFKCVLIISKNKSDRPMCNLLFTAQFIVSTSLVINLVNKYLNLMLFAYIPMGNNFSSNTSRAFLFIGTLKRSKTRYEHNFGVFSST